MKPERWFWPALIALIALNVVLVGVYLNTYGN